MAATPIHVFARWKVKDGHLTTVTQLLKEVREATLQEKGNLLYQIHQSVADANTLLLFEAYADADAQQAHIHAAHFKKIVSDQIVPLLEEREVMLATPLEV